MVKLRRRFEAVMQERLPHRRPREDDYLMIESWTFRRDRIGETWHMVPAGEHGENGRAACGEPLQGTRLLEGRSAREPRSPEALCQHRSEQAPTLGTPVRAWWSRSQRAAQTRTHVGAFGWPDPRLGRV